MMIEKKGLHKSKKKVRNQNYENYWSITLGMTDFFTQNGQCMRTLQIIVDHIDKYRLFDYKISELQNGRKLNQETTHAQELAEHVSSIFQNVDQTGATTRKQLNQFIKLGFIKPFYSGYSPKTKEFLNPKTGLEKKKRLFSEIVYSYSSLNSSQTKDCTNINQIKYLVNTLINRPSKMINNKELIGLMLSQLDPRGYSTDRDILQNSNWADYIDFNSRKYNQINYLKAVMKSMNLFSVYETGRRIEVGNKKEKEIIFCLTEDAKTLIPERGTTRRDNYRFMLMKKSIFEESERIYGKKVSWLSKEESKGLVVSHIYASADALKNWDTDEAYDPNNALLLKPGDEDQYFDKYDMTFDNNGFPVFSSNVRESFVKNIIDNKYKLDQSILNPERLNYIQKYHNVKFKEKV